MTSIAKVASGDAQVYFNDSAAAIDGGVLVAGGASTANSGGLPTMTPTTDAQQTVVGVTAAPTVNFSAQGNATANTSYGYPAVDAGFPLATTTVYSHGIVPILFTAAAVAYGTPLVAAAAGKVRAYVSGTDNAAAIVGKCAQPGGVSSAGVVGLVRLFL